MKKRAASIALVPACLLAALRLIREGIPTGQALKLGIINKAFEPFERQLAADTVWARIPQDAGRSQLFGV